ncbi:tyrosine--tRNA ligase [Rufibacter tibetensis]|uniref:Tyrosine--tRNA ligase n=1 Tax=Rufibacter tibetensis TaxID=512763 RepID=A0A0P0CR75_9BACT|nr:tyrosine--tRNA ligase [Rufibacter tibetensis]ALI99935.1 tyrosyl-tRNA synthetase [Rufibacter tibetensis]
MKAAEQLNVLKANVEIFLPDNALEEKLQLAEKENRTLIIKLGFDPTAPDLHLGHAVVLKKLRQFQDFGHTIVIIIGDFTARIGDPTGKNKSRPPLNADQVQLNAQTYVNQLSKILDVSKCEIRYNSEWLGSMDMTETIKLLSQVTLAQIMQRTDFNNRFSGSLPISLHELVYPLLQGHDSVMIHADIEMGGTDQLFNCSMGRQLQEGQGQHGQAVLCMPLLKGIDGSAKMSKSEGNIVGLTDAPNEMFGKIMSIPDALLAEYLHLVTDFTPEEKQQLLQQLEQGDNPMVLKKRIGLNVVQQYHSTEAAEQAQEFFQNQFQNKRFEEKEFTSVSLSSLSLDQTGTLRVLDLCKELKAGESRSNLKKLIEAGSVTVNGTKVTDAQDSVELGKSPVKVRIGKRGYFEIVP